MFCDGLGVILIDPGHGRGLEGPARDPGRPVTENRRETPPPLPPAIMRPSSGLRQNPLFHGDGDRNQAAAFPREQLAAGCCSCIQSAACWALLAAVMMARFSSFSARSHDAT